MLQWQIRVTEERRDLDAKLAKLDAFIASPAFGNLDEAEQRRLRLQRPLMRAYSGILGQRIDAFKPE